MTARGQLLAALLGAALLAGCGHDEGPAGFTGGVAGQVVDFQTRAPIAGARVFLLDAARNTATGPVTLSDAAGRYHFAGITPGAYYLVAWAGGRLILFDPPGAALELRAGRVLAQDIRVGRYPYFHDDAPVVRGVVRDAVTGEPIGGAYVSVGDTDLAALFAGITVPWEAVTGADGRFVLGQVPVVSRGGVPLGLYPVMAIASGHAPAAAGSVRGGQILPLPAPGETLAVELRLAPRPGDGVLAGEVVTDGHPVAGVVVGAALVDSVSAAAEEAARAPRSGATAPEGGTGAHASGHTVAALPAPRALLPDATSITGPDGRFELHGVPAGIYRLHAAYLPDDGWVAAPPAPGHADDALVRLVPGGRAECRLSVLPAIRLLAPATGSAVASARPRFSWRALPGAEVYRLRFSNANGFILPNVNLTADTTLGAPPGYWGEGDWVRWAVEAWRADTLLGASDAIATFVVRTRGGGGL